MSMINKLGIQGVRSFGDDRQKIEFSTPLTLIVGQNGCGKTTIIECLKYALTGDTPPGSDRGRNFVHDVKLKSKTISDARVDLTITDPNGDDKTVFRSMRLENVKGKVKFQTFDSTIKYCGDTDKFTSGRVDDVNNHMCQSMGVSKAILNNVIFCHQEDSNWPLDEGKKLKEKFDAIFGTTEYNKAIANMLKIKKNYDDKLKNAKGEIKVWEEIKGQVEKKERSLHELKSKFAGIQAEYDAFKEKLTPLEDKKEQLMKKDRDYGALVVQEGALDNRIKNCIDQARSTEKNMTKKLTGMTKNDLEKELENFQENNMRKQKKLEKLEADNSRLINEDKENQKSLMELKNKAQNCTDDIQKLQERKSERFHDVKKICSLLNLEFDHEMDQSAETQEISETVKSIDKGIAAKEKEIQSIKRKASEEDENYQKSLDKLRDEKTKIETNLTSQRRSLKDFDENCGNIQKKLKESEESIPSLNRLKPKIDEYERKLKKLNDSNNIEELKENQNTLDVEIIETDESLSVIEKEIDVLQSASRITGELGLKESDVSKDQKEFDRIRNKLSSNMKNLFGKQTIESNFRAKVQSKRDELQQEVTATKDRLLIIQRDCDRMLDQRVSLRTQQKQKDQEIQKIEQEAKDLCRRMEYHDFLASQKEKVEKLNLELAVEESSVNTYRNFIEKINDTPCCPLCHKGLENDESDYLKVELEEKIDGLPKTISTIRAKLKTESQVYDKIIAFKSSYESLTKLKEEKSKLETDLENLDTKVGGLNEERDNLEAVLAEPESLLNIITHSFFTDVSKLDDLQRSITSKTKDINALKDKLPSDIPKKTLTEAQNERKSMADKVKASNERIKQINEEINSFQAELNDAREKLNKLNAEKNEFQQKVQGIEVLKDQLSKIKNDKKDLEAQIKDNESKLKPTMEKFRSLNEEKMKSSKRHQKEIDTEQDMLNKVKIDQSKIKHLEGEIGKYENMDLEDNLKKFSQKMSSLKEALKSLNDKKDKLAVDIKELTDLLANEQTTRRNIVDNISLLNYETQKKAAETELEELKKEIGDLDMESMKREKLKVLSEIQKIHFDRQKLGGKEEELNNRIGSIEEELKEPKYVAAKEKYLETISQSEVFAAASSDLKKYCSALEKSLLKYHQEKMDQINQIMKQLWNSIYQGNDIDCIIIKTDEEEVSAAATEKSRRSYNYRVVQVKQGIEIDMRGRCSAGQKVLASLIIRIALADTFSSSCGILALDEPTTNLDQNNVASLSHALAELVNDRDNGRFMLLVITHDENFVKSLEKAEKFWRVSRDPDGCSLIEEIRNY